MKTAKPFHRVISPSYFFEMDEVMYFGCIKFNHKDLLVRRLEETKRDGAIAMIAKSNDLYLTPKSKTEEGFIVHLKFMDIALLDKSYTVREKSRTFGDLVLGLSSGMV